MKHEKEKQDRGRGKAAEGNKTSYNLSQVKASPAFYSDRGRLTDCSICVKY